MNSSAIATVCVQIIINHKERTIFSQFVNLGNFSKIFLYTVPILLCFIALLLFYVSFTMEWIEYPAEPNQIIKKIITDDSGNSFDTSLDGASGENEGICPFVDVSALIEAILSAIGGLFGFLGVIFSRFLLKFFYSKLY